MGGWGGGGKGRIGKEKELALHVAKSLDFIKTRRRLIFDQLSSVACQRTENC